MDAIKDPETRSVEMRRHAQMTEEILALMLERQKLNQAKRPAKAKKGAARKPAQPGAGGGMSGGMMGGGMQGEHGMMGGEMSQSMQQLRQSAAGGEGQMRATLDLAKEMGSGIQRQQEMRRARGAMLFQEYRKKMNMNQNEAAATPAATPTPERQKISEK